jgi:hypothetical protein
VVDERDDLAAEQSERERPYRRVPLDQVPGRRGAAAMRSGGWHVPGRCPF